MPDKSCCNPFMAENIMIAKITGKIDEIKPTDLVLDVNGVGYGLRIPLSTYEKIVSRESATLYVYTLHKEDQFKLFGFYSEQEKELFTILINISGIGPSVALSILSGISAERLIQSVRDENTGLLVKIPGIGKAKAEKLVFELKRKLKKISTLPAGGSEGPSIKQDAVEALMSLGFDENRAAGAVESVIKENPEASIEHVVKESLKQISA